MSAARVPGFQGNKLLYSEASGGDSGWQDATSLNVPFTAAAEGIVGADRVQIRVSTREQKPDVADLGLQFGADFAADGYLSVTTPFRWVRMIRTVKTGGGAVTASFFGFRSPAS